MNAEGELALEAEKQSEWWSRCAVSSVIEMNRHADERVCFLPSDFPAKCNFTSVHAEQSQGNFQLCRASG